MRDDKLPGKVFSKTYEFRVKGYVVTVCHFTDEETEAPNYGSRSLVLHRVRVGVRLGIHAFFSVASTVFCVGGGDDHHLPVSRYIPFICLLPSLKI